MGILILRYTGWYFGKNILQNSLNFVLHFSWNIRLFRCFCSAKSFYFFQNIRYGTNLGDNFFSMSVILDFGFILAVKNGCTVFQKVLLSVISLVLILLKKFFFSLLIKFTQRLHCLLYAFRSMSLFVFKNKFLRRDLFIIYLSFYSWKALGLLEHTALSLLLNLAQLSLKSSSAQFQIVPRYVGDSRRGRISDSGPGFLPSTIPQKQFIIIHHL